MFNKKRIYLDAASGISGNPSSSHEEGRAAKSVLEDARLTISRLVEVQSDDVVFTGGATEANAIAILGVVRAARARIARPHILYLPSAHASIVENVGLLAEEGVLTEPLPLAGGRVDTSALIRMIRPETVLVVMEAVCGETGVVWNTREVAAVLQKTSSRSKILLHVDASQAPQTEKITRSHFGADTITFDASKVSKARGIGALIAHRTIPILPLYRGGGQERGLRPGSEAPALAREFANGLTLSVANREKFCKEWERQRTTLISALDKKIPALHINEGHNQAPNILNISLIGRDTDYLVALLDEEGFAISTRSACETDSDNGSRAVLALTLDNARARSTLRVSWCSEVKDREFTRFTNALIKAVSFIDSSGVG